MMNSSIITATTTKSQEHPAITKARLQAKRNMSITQTFYLAHKARGKLSVEAAKSDHDLRLLVLHANTLDSLMLHLSQVEQAQDDWFNNMVRGNATEDEDEEVEVSSIRKASRQEPAIGWIAEDYSDSGSNSDDSESDEDDYTSRFTDGASLFLPSLDIFKSINQIDSFHATTVEVDPNYDSDDSEEDDEDDSDGLYALERTSSHRLPSLVEDLSDSDDEEATPPSPPQLTISMAHLSESDRKQLAMTSYYTDSPNISKSDSHLSEGFYLHEASNLIAAY